MGHTVSTGDVERRGLRLLVRLLHDPGSGPDPLAVRNWVDEATTTLRSSDLVSPALEDTFASVEPLEEGDGWSAMAAEQLLLLTGYLQELGDLEVQLHGGRAFISYVREDSEAVDRLAGDLRCCGIKVWLDRAELGDAAGLEWSTAIRDEIEDGSCFIACFSEAWTQRRHTYADEEVAVALAQMRTLSVPRRWFFPVELTPNSIPELTIETDRRVSDLQSVQLHDDWYRGVMEISDAILPPSGKVRTLRDPLFDSDPKVREEGARQVHYFGDHRQLIPLLHMCDQQFALLDEDSTPDAPAAKNSIENVLYEALRALGALGRNDDRNGERALPVYIEMADRDLWTYKVKEVMASQRSARVRSLLRAYETASVCRFTDLLGDHDAESIDLDELHRRALEFRTRVTRLGL